MMSAFVPLLDTFLNFANSTNIAFFIFFNAASFGTPTGFDVTGAAVTGSFHMYGLTNQVIGDPVFVVSADAREFSYSVEENGIISQLAGSYDGEVEPTEFTLVEGEGDDDHGERYVDDLGQHQAGANELDDAVAE